MPDYRIFGGVLRSAVAFRELPPATGDVSWSLDLGTAAPVEPVGESLGVDDVHGDTKVRAFRTQHGYSLVYDDTGRFDITADASRITWYSPGDALVDAARADVIGRVLPFALHLRGVLCLHASAVALGAEGVAFLAPKFYGKSSLATALVGSGASLITDDVLPVSVSDARYLPGVPSLRLWPDAAAQLNRRGPAPAPAEGKVLLEPDPEGVSHAPGRLTTAYLLAPVPELPAGQVVERVRLPGIPAALSLVSYARVGPLLSGNEAGRLFTLAAELASRVSVFELRVVRDLHRIQEVAAAVRAWHTHDGLAG